MKKFLVVALVVLGLLLSLAILLLLGYRMTSSQRSIAGRLVLEADFERGYISYRSDDPLDQLFNEQRPTVQDLVDALDRAAQDDRVVSLIARVGSVPVGMAQVQEMRDAVQRFRAAGKRAIAHAETFGEFGPGDRGYYLATAFDEIHLQPSGGVGLTGMVYEAAFVAGTLEKLGVQPQFDRRHEYKNAPDFYTETALTPANREALTGVVVSRFGQIARGVGQRTGLDEDAVRTMIDDGPFESDEALDRGLVDVLSYRDEVYTRVLAEAGESARLLYLHRYLKRAGRPHRRGATVALVHAVGAIMRGESGYDPFAAEHTAGSDSVRAALRSAIEDDDVVAIVLRVDSPGGSYVGSDSIYRETVRARDAGKPIIVSMGDVAASGGYFVSMAADKIVAQPATITGSIGVYAGKMWTREMWAKIGVTFDQVQIGRHASMYSPSTRFSPSEWEKFRQSLDRIYDDFTGKVASERELPREDVEQAARGRIWTGEEAKRLGLVDELGGIDVALELAREAAGLAPGAEVRLRRVPPPKSIWEALFGEPADSSRPDAAALARSIELLRPVVGLARQLGAYGEGGVLRMEPLPLDR